MSILTREYIDRMLGELAEAEEVHRERRSGAELALTALMQRLIPVGTLIDVDSRERPEWLASVKVVTGHPRGARVFEIAAPVTVTVPNFGVDMAEWRAYASPVHPSGKRSAHVRLKCDLCVNGFKEGEDDLQRMLTAAFAALA